MTSANRTDEKLAELNQPSLWSGINAYRSDPLIVDLTAALPRGIREDLENMGRYVTSPEAQEMARMANQGAPQLRPTVRAVSASTSSSSIPPGTR